MSNIIKHDGNTIEGLTIRETNIILAKGSSKIKDLPNEELNKSIINLVNTIYATAGQRASDDDIKALCILLKTELKTYFNNASINEVEIACSKGIRKEYGEYFGISIVSINNWINKYLNSEERINSIKKYQNLIIMNQQQNELSQAEKDKIMLDSVDRLKEYSQTKEFNVENFDFGNAVYDFLVSKGTIDFTTDEKNEFMEIAKEHLKRDAMLQKVRFEITHGSFNKILSVIEAQKSKPVVILAKKYALKKYFDSQITKKQSNRSDDYMNPDYFNKF
jgi:hypothetical protein